MRYFSAFFFSSLKTNLRRFSAKKTYTPCYLSHEKKYNRGEEEFVIIRGHHEPIISREMFEQANAILDGRALSPEGKSKHSNRYPLSGKVKCAKCSGSFVAHYRKRGDGTGYKTWRCYEAGRNGTPKIDPAGNHIGCKGGCIREDEAMYIMRQLVGSFAVNRKEIRDSAMRLTRRVIEGNKPDIESAIEELVCGDTDDGYFYRELLSRMMVVDNNHIDVFLNLLPFRWSYAVQKGGVVPTFASSVPISVSTPVTFPYGHENR